MTEPMRPKAVRECPCKECRCMEARISASPEVGDS